MRLRNQSADFSFNITLSEDPLLSSAIGLVAKRLENPIALTQELEKKIQATIEQSFKSQSAPDGSPWAKLAESTLRKPGKRNSPILVDTGELRENAIAVVADNFSVEIIFPEHGRYHMSGTRNMPARPFAPTAKDLTTGKLGREIRDLMKRYATQVRGRGFGP